MWVGVCCECQQGGKPLRWHPGGGYVIDYHESFGSSCEGEGTAPQATYQAASGSDQMPEGVHDLNGNDLKIVKSLFPEHNVRSPDVYPDDFDREEQEREQAKEDEKNVCCSDPWCNHRPDPPKPPGVFGTIGDLLLAAKNGKQKTKKRG